MESGTIAPRPRIKKVGGVTDEVEVGCGKLYVTANFDKYGFAETFISTGAAGVCPGFSQGLSRLISLCARCGIGVEYIIDQLCSVSCKNCKGVGVKSCPDAVGKIIKSIIEGRESRPELKSEAKEIEYEDQVKPELAILKPNNKSVCPQCGAGMYFSEGCRTCQACGFSKCG